MSDENANVHPEEVEEAEDQQGRPPRDAQGAHAAGDALGGDRLPTGNDGTMGGSAPAGDASLNESNDVAPEGD